MLLFEPGQINMKPEILEELSQKEECRVHQGQWIATAALPTDM